MAVRLAPSAKPADVPPAPPPAMVVTFPLCSDTARIKCVSEKYTAVPAGSTATPFGSFNVAVFPEPSAKPLDAPRAIVVAVLDAI